jgi:CheY-like chemotaxis protein
VWIEVRDSGSGMTEATQARIFDPFFTTKFTGRGLGLAAVSGIVRGHEGRMKVVSALGQGSTFRIAFPAVERLGQTKEPAVVKDGRGSGTVLVVDDEPALRKIARAILENSGYRVLVAEDGREAVELFRQHADTITVILLDMNMPVMGGEEAFGLIRAIRADVPIVVSTGFSEVTTRELFGGGIAVGFVQKPYTAARLCERIQTASRAAQATNASRQ